VKRIDDRQPPASRGRLLYVADVRREIFRDGVSEWWIRKNVAPDKKIRLGHSTVAWWEYDVLQWIENKKEVA
jgi:hypothetical protein